MHEKGTAETQRKLNYRHKCTVNKYFSFFSYTLLQRKELTHICTQKLNSNEKLKNLILQLKLGQCL